MNKIKRILVALLALCFVGSLAACGTNNFRDLEGASSTDPDYVRLVNSPDGHPNVVLYCADGVAYATTTRDYDAFQFVIDEDFVKFCKSIAAAGSGGEKLGK